MEVRKIIFGDGETPNNELEAYRREYRGDVSVEFTDGRRYKVVVFTPRRIAQDLARMVEFGQPFIAEAGIVIVTEVTAHAIHTALNGLSREDFFDQLVPLD